jgi:plastocyanin
MRAPLSRIAALLIAAATGAGCGSDGGSGLGESVLTTLVVTPATATLLTVAPGNAVTLAVVAKDQNGQTMAGSPNFSSDKGAIADVSNAGTITAVAAGTARITASLTIDGVTKTGTTTVTAQVAPANATVTAPGSAFLPNTVDVSAGGTVTWTFGSTPHQVSFTTAGAPADIPELQNGSASRTFPNHGSFNYQCSGPQMSGVVRVH